MSKAMASAQAEARPATWGAGAHARLAAVLQAAARDLDASGSDPDRIRRVRVALKEARALVRALEPGLGRRAVEVRLAARTIRQALGAQRDAEICAVLLEEVSGDLTGRAAQELREVFVEPAPGWVGQDLSPLRADIGALCDRVASWAEHASAGDVARGMAMTFRRARQRGATALNTRAAVDFHAWRAGVTDHRYQLDLITPAWPALLQAWSKAVRRLRADLGAYNDLTVFAGHPALEALTKPTRTSLQRLIVKRLAKHEARAAAAYGRLFCERPNAFARRIAAILAPEA